MPEFIQWTIYNAIMFGSLYGLGKLIEYQAWQVIENYDQYEEFFNKWIIM